jgi:hypothetical protein
LFLDPLLFIRIELQWTNVDADLPAGDKVFVSTCPASATFLRGHLGDYASTAQRKASLYRCGDSVEVAIDADGLRQQILLANVYFGIPKFGTLVECFDIPTDSCVAFAESLIDQLKPRTVVLMDVTKPGSFSTIVSSGEGLRYLATSVSPPVHSNVHFCLMCNYLHVA